ncbi:membrane protein, partial [human gut metagenome]
KRARRWTAATIPAKGWIKWVFVFVIPLAVASIVCGIFYAQMKTANEQTHANAYMPAEGLALSVVEDTYTHTTETETCDPVKDDSSSVQVPTAMVSAGARAGNSTQYCFRCHILFFSTLKVCYLAWYNLVIQSNIYQEGCCHGCKRR